MNVPYAVFETRADAVCSRIEAACAACGRDPSEVTLMAVTKTRPSVAADWAARYGLTCVGENRVQEGATKRPDCTAEIGWELIGHLQSNKARLAVSTFDRIQSVDRAKLIGALDRIAGEVGKTLPILLQINAGRDPAKYGADLDAADALLETALAAPHLAVDGLMTIAPLDDDPAVAARCFETLRDLRDRLANAFATPLPVLSMGMTGDLESAVAAGSTLVRVGTALYGER